MTTFNDLDVAPAMLFDEPEQYDDIDSAPSQAPPFASLVAEAQNYPPPTPEELAEADAILNDAFKPYDDEATRLGQMNERHRLLADYVEPHLIDLSKPAPILRPIIEHNDMIIASLGNISAVVGAAKSKKTFLCTAIVGGLLAERGEFGITPRLVSVLWVDTEQSLLHVRKVSERIHRLAGMPEDRNSGLLHTLTLREIEPKARSEMLYMAIELYEPQLVVIDGISDLMYNTNDIEESDRVVGRLMALSTDYNCHIICVLHTNPNSDKARGHIGSTLQRKAETVLFVHKVGDCSVVEPQFCRNEEFEPFAFTIDDEGLPTLTDLPSMQSEQEDDCVAVMRDYFPNGVERKVLTNKLIEVYDIPPGTARSKISRAVNRGVLRASHNMLLINE